MRSRRLLLGLVILWLTRPCAATVRELTINTDPQGATIVGPYGGELGHSGEKIHVDLDHYGSTTKIRFLLAGYKPADVDIVWTAVGESWPNGGPFRLEPTWPTWLKQRLPLVGLGIFGLLGLQTLVKRHRRKVSALQEREAQLRGIERVDPLGGERALILEGAGGVSESLKLVLSRGLEPDRRWEEQVSIGLLDEAVREGIPVLMGDAQASSHEGRWSLMLSEIRSVLCVPFWDRQNRIAGLLYADARSRTEVFSRQELLAAQQCARRLEQGLFGQSSAAVSAPDVAAKPVRAVAPVATRGSLGLRRAGATGAIPAPVPTLPAGKPTGSKGATPHGLVIFFRSLAAMVGAGLPIMRAFDVLAQHSEDSAVQLAANRIASQIHGGCSLSAAMSACDIFDRFDTRMVRVGETTGSLHLVLRNLADYRERAHAANLRLRSAFAYPAMVVGLCLLMMLGVPYVLEGQFQIIRASGQTPPLLTRGLMAVSAFLSHPLGLPLVLLAAIGAVLGLAQSFRRPSSRATWLRFGLKQPGVGRLLRLSATARFASAMAVMSRAGVALPECLTMSAAASSNPVLEESIHFTLAAVENGDGLADSLAVACFFPKPFLQLARVGEESGKVDTMMAWLAELYEREVASAIQQWLALLEPALMMGLGILVALLLLATLMPMMSVVQSL